MKQKYWLCKRGNVYYSFDSGTGKRENLQTNDEDESKRILDAKNDAPHHAAINISIAKAYLLGSDPKLVERTWRFVLDEFCSRGKYFNTPALRFRISPKVIAPTTTPVRWSLQSCCNS